MEIFKKLFKKNTDNINNIEGIIAEEEIDEIEVQQESEVRIQTTDEELISYGIIIGLLSSKINPSRIILRDKIKYCGILLDDNNRKPLARLYLESSKMYIGTFDENRNETKHSITSINDICELKKELIKVLKYYEI